VLKGETNRAKYDFDRYHSRRPRSEDAAPDAILELVDRIQRLRRVLGIQECTNNHPQSTLGRRSFARRSNA